MDMQRHLRTAAIILSGVLVVASLHPALAQQHKMGKTGYNKSTAKTMTKTGGTTTLYDRLGGMKGIEELADHFVTTLYSPIPNTTAMGTTTTTETTTTTGKMDHTGMDHSTMGTTGTTNTTSTSKSPPAGTGAVSSTGVSGTAGATGTASGTAGTYGTAGTSTTTDNTGAMTNSTGTAGMANRKEMKGTPATAATTGAENTDPQGLLRTYVAARICVVAGGTCQEPRVPLRTLQGRVNASTDQWTYAMNDLRSTLDSRNIPKSDQEEVMTSLATMMHETTGGTMMGTTGTTTAPPDTAAMRGMRHGKMGTSKTGVGTDTTHAKTRTGKGY